MFRYYTLASVLSLFLIGCTEVDSTKDGAAQDQTPVVSDGDAGSTESDPY